MEQKSSHFLSISIAVSFVIIAVAYVYAVGARGDSLKPEISGADHIQVVADLERQMFPEEGVEIPVRWGNLGARILAAGVIDAEKLLAVYDSRGGLSEEERALLSGEYGGNLRITHENSGLLLNLLWALGLGNKSEILESGPMVTYDGRDAGSPAEALAKAGRFASTGGWIIAKGDAMNHYSRHMLVPLTGAQEELVARVAKNIYRPCCDNSTHFPDCNHGMAMLGLLQLMAAQGMEEEDMYFYALQVNAHWFPDTYVNIARDFQSRGVVWSDIDPKDALGAEYSSASGYARVLSRLEPYEYLGEQGCGL